MVNPMTHSTLLTISSVLCTVLEHSHMASALWKLEVHGVGEVTANKSAGLRAFRGGKCWREDLTGQNGGDRQVGAHFR